MFFIIPTRHIWLSLQIVIFFCKYGWLVGIYNSMHAMSQQVFEALGTISSLVVTLGMQNVPFIDPRTTAAVVELFLTDHTLLAIPNRPMVLTSATLHVNHVGN